MGCESRSIKIVNSETTKCVINEHVNGSISAIHFDGKNRIVYGTKEGHVASFRVSNLGKGTETRLVPGMTFPQNKNTKSPVNVIESYDITNDGVQDLIVGHDDGTIRVFGFERGTPILQFETSLGESIRSIKGGKFCNPRYDEIVVCTYSGRVVSLTREHLEEEEEEDEDGDEDEEKKVSSNGSSKAERRKASRIEQIHSELDELREQVKRQRRGEQQDISSTSLTSIKSNMSLDHVDGTYTVSVETPLPLESVIIQSSMDISISCDKSSAASMHVSRPEESEGNRTLAVFRFEEDTGGSRRLQMTFRTFTLSLSFFFSLALYHIKKTHTHTHTYMHRYGRRTVRRCPCNCYDQDEI